jgi:hypothetical protein
MNTIKKEIKEKSRKLQGTWTAFNEPAQPEYSKDLVDEMAKTLREEIDWEIAMNMFKEVGYTHITMPWPDRMDEAQAHEIKTWCLTNLAEHFFGRGPDWLFKNEKDATLFVLRWS